MRKVNVKKVREAVRKLVIDANIVLRPDIRRALDKALRSERNVSARGVLRQLKDNAKIAEKEKLAICQDTGMAFVFIEVGQKVSFTGGDIKKAIDDGVRLGYRKGYFRKSVVGDPILRKNTKTNTPAIIHTDIVKGDKVRLIAAPKGFGCENKSLIKMFEPTSGPEEIEAFVLDTVKSAGPDACPPFIIGIGIGGTMDKAALLAKRALLRDIGRRNPKKHIADIETRLLGKINRTGIGPMGLGGTTTALAVNILTYPTHIAGLPVAVNIGCHATRSAEMII